MVATNAPLHRRIVVSPATAGGAASLMLGWLAIALRWQGGDWPAQLYRIDLFRRVGFTQWDNQWYGGHHSPGYSLLFPMLGDLVSPVVVGMASGVAAAAAFALVANRGLRSPRLAIALFAIATGTEPIVRRLTFALGI